MAPDVERVRCFDCGSGDWSSSPVAVNRVSACGNLCRVDEATEQTGQRILVDGLMGSGKSTFSRALATRTGLPLIHLDLHYWQPGWARPSDDEWRDCQRELLAGNAWIIDGNYNETLDLRLERAETVIYLHTPWWRCASRALVRGVRPPVGEMPAGCTDSFRRRLLDEWSGAWNIWRHHRSETSFALSEIGRLGPQSRVHVLRSKQEARTLLDTFAS